MEIGRRGGEGFYQRAFRTIPRGQEVLSIAYYLDDPHFDDLTSPAAQAYDLYFAWMTDFGLGRFNEAYQPSSDWHRCGFKRLAIRARSEFHSLVSGDWQLRMPSVVQRDMDLNTL